MASEVIVRGFDNVYSFHLGKNPLSVLELTEKINNVQKEKSEDVVDIYGLTPEDYELKKEGSEEVLEIDYIVQPDDVLILCAKQT